MNEPAWSRLRSAFPILRERSYFACQSLGPLPAEALDDLEEYRQTLLLRNRAYETWLGRMQELTGLVEDFLNAPRGSVALRDSATACQASIAASIRPTKDRNRIVIAPSLDFRSSRYLWSAQVDRQFSTVEVGRGEAWLSAEELCASIDERVAIVALPLVSPQTGALLPIREVAAHARKMGALTVVDAYQAVGIVPVDADAMGADVIVAGTHKWMCSASFGLAFMYVSPAVSERLLPAFPGWIGHEDLTASTSRFVPAPGARRFQQGTPALEPMFTARAGLRFLQHVGVDRMRQRSLELTECMLRCALEFGTHVRTPTQPDRRGGMLCLDLPDAGTMAATLMRESIDVDARPDAGLRIGPFPCLEEEECRRIMLRIGELSKAAK